MWIRLDYILAAAAFLGHITLLTILFRCRLLARLPLFATLMVFYLLRSSLLFIAHFAIARPAWYWLLIYIDPALQILLIAVTAYRTRAGLLVALPLFAIVAAFASWNLGNPWHYSPQTLASKLSFCVSILWLLSAAAIFWKLPATSLRIRLSRDIALGFAVYSAANIVAELARMHVAPLRPPALYTGLAYFTSGVYLCCLAGWSVLLWRDTSRAQASLHSTQN